MKSPPHLPSSPPSKLPPWFLYSGAAVAVAVFLAVAFYPSTKGDQQQRSAEAPAPAAAQTPWEQLWSKALSQPVLGCREAPGARTFVACACPGAPPRAADSQCQPDPAWPGHRLIGALQAVLRVGHPDDVWVDWEPGPELSQALQQLPCNLPEEAQAARTAIVNAASGGPEGGPAAGNAALQLLGYLEQNPSCAA